MKMKFDGNIVEFFGLFGGIAVPALGARAEDVGKLIEEAEDIEGDVHLWIDDDEFEFTMRGEMK